MTGWLGNRAPQLPLNEPLLDSLDLSEGTLVPQFDSFIFDYEVTVPAETTTLIVTGVPTDPDATMSENNNVPQALDRPVTEIAIAVEDTIGNSTTYTVTVNRGE